MKLATLAAAALLTAAPAFAQTTTTAPSTWQLTQFCTVTFIEVDIRTKEQTERLKTGCTGATVSVKDNVNVHFSTVHPSLSRPILSFILTEGPYQGKHPVDQAVIYLGSKDQANMATSTGQCFIDSRHALNFVNCVAASKTDTDGKYLMVLGVAGFREPLAPEIRAVLR